VDDPNNTILRHISDALTFSPVVYDKISRLAGSSAIIQVLQPHLSAIDNGSLLDVGAGTGLYLPILSPHTKYIWSDIDLKKLEGFKARSSSHKFAPLYGMMCDSTRIALDDRAVDYVLCAALSHHIADGDLSRLFGEMARVVRKKLIFMDAVKLPTMLSRVLWAIDRGAFPRSETSLCSMIERDFDIESKQSLKIYHKYLVCVCTPK